MAASGVSPSTGGNAASNSAPAPPTDAAAQRLANETLAAAQAAQAKVTGDVPSQPIQLTGAQAAAVFTAMGWAMVIPIVFSIIFASGAAYLSYQRFGAIGWAILDFFFAYIYYPYYAFFISTEPPPSMGILGGRRRKH